MLSKKQIRQNCLKLRENLSNFELEKYSKDISEKLLKTTEYKKAKNIFIYLSFGKEVDTKYIIDIAKKDKKQIFVPVLKQKKGQMTFKPLVETFYRNKFGIKEPKTDIEKQSDDSTLIIVPALAYTKDGYRIGYGGGYYDYFLDNNIYMASIGLCINKFIINFEPENFDKKVDTVITEQNIYK